MYRIFDCIAYEHHYGLLSLAVVSCVIGALLTVLQTRRMLKAHPRQRALQIALVSIIGGATIWSTHFLAMLAYDPGVPHAYEPVVTALSLAVAVAGFAITNAVAVFARGPARLVGGGLLFGVTVSTMHYMGMSAYQIPGQMIWDPVRVIASLAAGAALGVAAYHRMFFPVTRICWLGGVILMIMAICAMHFTGMSAFYIQLDGTVQVPAAMVSDEWFGITVVVVTGLLYLIGFFSFQMEVESTGQLRFVSLHDPLTKLPNRMQLMQKLDEMDRMLERDGTSRLAVLMLDLDGFKHINEIYGRQAGDLVLTEVARRLESTLGPEEWVARSGSDEFVVLKTDFRRVEQIHALSERVMANVVAPVVAEAFEVTLQVSIGLATTINEARDAEGLMRKADVALHHAKQRKDTVTLQYSDALEEQDRSRLEMIEDMRRALTNDEFALVYQRQNTIETEALVGFEALIRWHHPTKGMIPPGQFIPLAEETGQIREIGLWVLRTACAEAASWHQPHSIAINVAPQQLLQTRFVDQVAFILDETELEPSRLELEITEATMIDDMSFALAAMTRLKDMGVRIAMDDFGTGYSSLSTLQAFPFDKIKIDRSFITDVHENPQRAAIVRSTLLLGQALNIPVLAEGVEVGPELEFLKAENCGLVQGYFFGKPLTLEEMRTVLAEQEAAAKAG